ncbi:MAG: hypothetical protein ACFFAO_03750, partial [Candidatus Hermodarchaeota archaeon]
NLLTYTLKSIFHKKKVVIILDDLRYQTRLRDDLLNFFKYIIQDSFDADISIMNKELYNKNQKKLKNNMVFQGNEIRRNSNNTINPKQLKFEKNIVQQFIFEYDPILSIIVLKEEISKLFNLSKEITEFIKKQKKDEKPNILKIQNYLEEVFNIKISNFYMNFLIKIVESYFGITLTSFAESFFDIL